MESQTGKVSMGGGHATVEENHQKEGGVPTTTSSSSSTRSLGPTVKGTLQACQMEMIIWSEVRAPDATVADEILAHH